MKTLFTLGLPGSFDFWNPPAPDPVFMGQANGVNPDDRNAMLQALQLASSQWITVSQWLAGHPNKQADLAEDYSTFMSGYASAQAIYGQAMIVQQTLGSTNPTDWIVSASDWAAANQWITLVSRLYTIAEQRTTVNPMPAGAAPGSPIPSAVLPGTPGSSMAPARPVATPAAASSGISPLAIGAMAVGAVGLIALVTRA